MNAEVNSSELSASSLPDPKQIKDMFASIAEGYDRANSVLSAGIHHLWRKNLVGWSEVRSGQNVLDCATGTGDLALEFKKAVGSTGHVLGTDFCAEMLESAPAKAQSAHLTVEFQLADVTQLPFEAARFDVTSISFGIRNVADRVAALKELARVTKVGGRVMILEFGQPKNPVVRGLYQFYSSRILPFLGGLVTGKPQAYRYLEKSSARFPCREEFVALMKSSAAFKTVEYKSLSFGVAYIYKATV